MPFISLKKLGSRSRTGSHSYSDGPEIYEGADHHNVGGPRYDDGYGSAATHDSQTHNGYPQTSEYTAGHDSGHASLPSQAGRNVNNTYTNGMTSASSAPQTGRPSISVETPTSANFAKTPSGNDTPVADMFAQVFNTALVPYTARIEALEQEVAELRIALDTAQATVAEADDRQDTIYQWIDARGLRPDMPPSFRQHIDSRDSQAGSTKAATLLYTQLNRKINVVNYDLHRLQDDLNNAMQLTSFAPCMMSFLPQIDRLATLPGGAEYAGKLISMLGSTIINHADAGQPEGQDAAVIDQERMTYFNKLDIALYPIMESRLKLEGYKWVPKFRKNLKKLVNPPDQETFRGQESFFAKSMGLLAEAEDHAISTGELPPPPPINDGAREDSPRRNQYGGI